MTSLTGEVNKILKANTKQKASSRGGGGVRTPAPSPYAILTLLCFIALQLNIEASQVRVNFKILRLLPDIFSLQYPSSLLCKSEK